MGQVSLLSTSSILCIFTTFAFPESNRHYLDFTPSKVQSTYHSQDDAPIISPHRHLPPPQLQRQQPTTANGTLNNTAAPQSPAQQTAMAQQPPSSALQPWASQP